MVRFNLQIKIGENIENQWKVKLKKHSNDNLWVNINNV